MRHVLLIVVAGFVLVGLIYREEIFCLEDEKPEAEAITATEPDRQIQPPIPEQKIEPEPQMKASGSDVIIEARAPGPEVQSTADETTSEIVGSEPEQTVAQDPSGQSLIEEEADAYSFRPEAGAASDTAELEMLIQKARAAYWRGDEEAAIDYYRQLIKASPADPDAHGELGNVLLKQGKRADAVGEYRRAISLLVERGESHLAAAFMNTVAEEFPGEIDDLRDLLETSAADDDSQNNL